MTEVGGANADELSYMLQHKLEATDPNSGWDVVVSDRLAKGYMKDKRVLVVIKASAFGAPRVKTGAQTVNCAPAHA